MKKLLFLLPLLACILMGCHDEPKPTPPKYPTYPTFNADDCAALHDLYVALGVDTDQLYDWPHWITPKFDGVTLERDWDADELRVVGIDISYLWVPEGYRIDNSFDFTRFERLDDFRIRHDVNRGFFEIPLSLFRTNISSITIAVFNKRKPIELPEEFFQTPNLKRIELSGFNFDEPNFLEKFKVFGDSLKVLKLKWNNLQGEIPLFLGNIMQVDISNNNFSSLPWSYFALDVDYRIPWINNNSLPIHLPISEKESKRFQYYSACFQGTEIIWVQP